MMEGNIPILTHPTPFLRLEAFEELCAVLPKDSTSHRRRLGCCGWTFVALRPSPLTKTTSHFLSFFMFNWTLFLIPGSHTATKLSSTSPLLSHQRYPIRQLRPATRYKDPEPRLVLPRLDRRIYRQRQLVEAAALHVPVHSWKFRGRKFDNGRHQHRQQCRYAKQSMGSLGSGRH
jgi:hypothetical protein